MRVLTRHLAIGYLLRAAGLAAGGAGLGVLVGLIEEGNRSAAGSFAAGWLGAIARVPEVLFFATPLVAVLSVLWTARDLVPPPVTEGLEGAGLPAGRIDSAMALAALGLVLVSGLLGGWLAPLAQHAADRRTAWERAGGVPAWTQRGWTWIRSGGVLARVAIEGDRVRVTRAFEFGPDGPVDVPVTLLASRPGGVPSAEEVRLLATPPALLTLPELLEAARVRDEYGHPPAPVRAEAALRLVLIGLSLPATVTGLACRRLRRAGRRWAFVAGFVFVAMLGLQASHVWATRGELPVWMVVVLPLATGSVVAALAWRWAGSYSHSQ